MNLQKNIFTVILVISSLQCLAQNASQTIRGTVMDKVSQITLPGATIIVLNSNPAIGSSTDNKGQFKLSQVPVGKQSLKITFLGYKEVVLNNVIVNSGKEVVLNIQMEEDAVQAKEIVVSAKQQREKPLNSMSTVSARSFTVEETTKYAAAVNDPGRMALAYTGVMSTDDGNNKISIRGNSPNGILWRMEGVEIPNPNHFANVGTSGGGISILSSQLLAESDFITGAFASEYGNATSGVFDLKLRKGNNEKREYTLQAGFLGLDISTEGPFKKGYGGSYLINYRYSTLGMLAKMGVPIGNGLTTFQDAALNISLPTQKAGNFTIFGFGGLSSDLTKAKKDSAEWINPWDRTNSRFNANTGAGGITHFYQLGSKSYLKSVALLSASDLNYKEEYLNNSFDPELRDEQSYVQSKFTLSSTMTNKISAKSSFRTGIILNQLGFNLVKKYSTGTPPALKTFVDKDGQTQTIQAFFQWNYILNEKWMLNTGFHYMMITLNGSQSPEPRAALKYSLNEKNSFSFGYGLHSQVQPTGVYFVEMKLADGTISQPNKDLGFTKSQHFVLGYDKLFTEYFYIKTEVYYQGLFNVPVSPDPKSNLSIINVSEGYAVDSLVNKGFGRNYGVELTAERFLYNNLYFLLSASFFNSEYKPLDGIWRSTRYNSNYVLAFTGGKEFEIGSTKKRSLGLNVKLLSSGGLRSTPIDEAKSIAAGEEVRIEELAFTKKEPDYFRTDIRLSLKRNRAHSTTTLALDIQNVTDRKNVYGQYFNSSTGKITTAYQAPLIPILSYRIEF